MTERALAEVLARAAAATVASGDVTGALADLMRDGAAALGASSAGIIVTRRDGAVEFLAATTHRAADLEVAQLQGDEGPCLDTIRESTAVRASGREELTTRWPTTGPRIVEGGYLAVHGAPMRWRGTCVGGFNLFFPEPVGVARLDPPAQGLADAATLLVVGSALDSDDALWQGLDHSLAERVVVEQAKGALGHVRRLDGAAAYEALAELATAEGLALGDASRAVLDRARQRTLR